LKSKNLIGDFGAIGVRMTGVHGQMKNPRLDSLRSGGWKNAEVFLNLREYSDITFVLPASLCW
jgi:hypothetical protein